MNDNARSTINYENKCSRNWCGMETIAAALFGKTRHDELALLFEQSDKDYFLCELAKQTGTALNALQHELGRLQKTGLVERNQDGNRIICRANRVHPIFANMQSVVRKTYGLPAQIKAVLQLFAAQIRFITFYDYLTKGLNHARGDVGLLIGTPDDA